jgi:hypothetical protein
MNTPFYAAVVEQLHQMSHLVPDPRPRAKMVDLGLGLLCGEKPKTITSALEWLDQRQRDWSDDCRFFSQTQWGVQDVFDTLLRQAVTAPTSGLPPWIDTAHDDSLLRKTGRKIPGVAYARDPLSPPFQTNLVLGQRLVQRALLLPPEESNHPWRSLPIGFTHAPPAPKASRRDSPEQQAVLKEVRKKHRLSLVALDQLSHCRKQLDALPGGEQSWMMDGVDGSYANRTFFRGLPERTQVVARFRKDAKLRAYLPPDQRQGARK